MEAPGEVSDYCLVVEELCSARRHEIAGMLASMLVEALESRGRRDDVVVTLRACHAAGLEQLTGVEALLAKVAAESGGLGGHLAFVLRKVDTALDASALEALSWAQFRRLLRQASYLPGRPVYHSSGWGSGMITDLDEDEDEVEIEFATGRSHRVPWQTAVDTYAALDPEDLRALLMTDLAGLQAMAKEQPVELLRKALRLYRGKATSTQIKEALCDKVVPAKSWATFWKKAKAGAVEDPRIAVEGSAARPVFTLRKKALTLVEEARHALRQERDVHKLLAGFQAFLDRCTRDSDLHQILDYARERVGPLATSAKDDASMEALIWLEEHHDIDEGEFHSALRGFFGVDAGELDFRKLRALRMPKVRQRTVGFLPGLLGEGWQQRVAPELKNVPADCLEVIFEQLCENADPDQLVAVYESVAPFPQKNPVLLFLLTKAWAEGVLAGASRQLDPNVVARVIIHVLRSISVTRKGSVEKTRLSQRIITLLLGRRAMLKDLLEQIDQRTMQSLLNAGNLAGEEFPPKVQEAIEQAAHARFPDMLLVPEKPYWESEAIYCTREGIEAYRAEFQHLRDVKIPENSKAIGHAASLGDLSENAEWEAAVEEQRNLTGRAQEMEENLRKAKLLGEQDVPEGIVAPGTRVSYTDLGTGRSRQVRILGPWDSVHGDDVISYKAPLAKALLGHPASTEVEIDLPTGRIRVQIDDIEQL
ncbi:MAG: GreA/GreB family elongation factor [Planctomycetota bacterium]